MHCSGLESKGKGVRREAFNQEHSDETKAVHNNNGSRISLPLP
jgi:hypothetical protein